jgi:transcriptional regulator with XRE-family HTH domain
VITGEQVRAARKLLGWSQTKLAMEANMSPKTIGRVEARQQPSFERTLRRLQRALEAAGVEFTGGQLGVRLSKERPAPTC